MRLFAILLSAGLAHADASTPTVHYPQWAECRDILEKAAQQLARDGWGVAAEEATIAESADRITLSIDFSTDCNYHGGGDVVVYRNPRRKPDVSYWIRNESENLHHYPEPFYLRMKKAAALCQKELRRSALDGDGLDAAKLADAALPQEVQKRNRRR
jgi:hypothetical protein